MPGPVQHLALPLPAAAFAMWASASEWFGNAFSLLPLTIIAAVILTILAAPYFYRRALGKKGDKNLGRFLMSDPNMRDAIIEARTGKKPAAKSGEQPTKKDEAVPHE